VGQIKGENPTQSRITPGIILDLQTALKVHLHSWAFIPEEWKLMFTQKLYTNVLAALLIITKN
jgi:hypothetical protein